MVMRLFSRRGDPILDLIARETFALFPRCRDCGQRIGRFDDADVRVLVLRVAHRGPCPAPPAPDTAAGENEPER
jgi:hypothetical protein